MSLSNPQTKNPATRFMQWRGGEEGGGRVTYYDKLANEGAGAEIEVALPFSFIVLDELATLVGFNDHQQSGYWSNEVRDSNGILVARTKQGIQGRGTWQQLKEKNLNGLKFAQSVYIAFKDETGELQIGHIKMFGAAMSAWIDFKKKFDISQCAVFITEVPKRAKKGKNTYFVPVFEGQNMSEATKAEAVKLDEELQQYLNGYFQRKPDLDDDGQEEIDDGPTTPSKTVKTDDVEIEDLDATDDDDAGEEETPVAAPKTAPKKAVAGEAIPLKDVPF